MKMTRVTSLARVLSHLSNSLVWAGLSTFRVMRVLLKSKQLQTRSWIKFDLYLNIIVDSYLHLKSILLI